MSKLDTLQAFRCIGLTGVVIGHMTFAEEKYSGATLLPLAIKDFNQLFIDWFFVVSGFIMVMVSRGRFQVPREILKFVYARLARIYPPYWVYFFITLAVFLAMPEWVNSGYTEPNLWKSFLLIPDKTLPLVMVAWSLIFEMWFSIPLPKGPVEALLGSNCRASARLCVLPCIPLRSSSSWAASSRCSTSAL